MLKNLRRETMSLWRLLLMGTLSTIRSYIPKTKPSPTPFQETSVKHYGTTSKNATLKDFVHWTENSSLGTKMNKLHNPFHQTNRQTILTRLVFFPSEWVKNFWQFFGETHRREEITKVQPWAKGNLGGGGGIKNLHSQSAPHEPTFCVRESNIQECNWSRF